jgi:hypothetical protein
VNQVHSAWVGFEEAGKPGLNQLFMKDFYGMWMAHVAAPPGAYPQLAAITDDNHDGVIEVNRPAEIDALLAAVRAHLQKTGFPLAGRRLVWVSDSRAWYSSTESRALPREEHEAGAYASVYKYSHDVARAKAALGAGGCTDCHRSGSPFFQGRVLAATFDGDSAQPRWVANHVTLGISPFWVRLGAWREQWVKPALYGLAALLLLAIVLLALRRLLVGGAVLTPRAARLAGAATAAAVIVAAALVARRTDLLAYVTARRLTLDANHFGIALGVLGVTAFVAATERRRAGRMILGILLAVGVVSGALMLAGTGLAGAPARLAYTVLDVALAAGAATAAGLLLARPTAPPGAPAARLSVVSLASAERAAAAARRAEGDGP